MPCVAFLIPIYWPSGVSYLLETDVIFSTGIEISALFCLFSYFQCCIVHKRSEIYAFNIHVYQNTCIVHYRLTSTLTLQISAVHGYKNNEDIVKVKMALEIGNVITIVMNRMLAIVKLITNVLCTVASLIMNKLFKVPYLSCISLPLEFLLVSFLFVC
jgi:hypothetical protein